MTAAEKHTLLQACAFAQVFIKEADRSAGGLPSETHEAAAQLAAALLSLPNSIEKCACGCVEFQQLNPEVRSTLSQLPSFDNYAAFHRFQEGL